MTIAARLRAACNGHPDAKVPWPHRVLHEGADTIDELVAALKDVLPILEAVKFTVGLRGNQLDRMKRAHAAVAKATQPGEASKDRDHIAAPPIEPTP